jgi:mannose-6-phosphate isomerase
MQLLEFTPLYMERVWGGRGLETKLGRSLPENKVIGESWEIVDREDAQSVVASGQLAGKTLRELINTSAADLLGPDADPTRPFPILVKWLDCQDRLSLQVHPPAEIAPSLGGEPKTENWYVADTTAGASLIVGLKKGVTREQFEAALAENKAEDCVHRFPVKAGDSILVESGRMHAIDAGNLILEIQQNSDTTYRVYDWGRVGLDGAPRQLHIEESLKSIDFNDFEPAALTIVPGEQVLADCREFRIRKFELQFGDPALELPAGNCARLIHIVSGSVTDATSGAKLTQGNNYLQPYVTGASLIAGSATTLLITDQF